MKRIRIKINEQDQDYEDRRPTDAREIVDEQGYRCPRRCDQTNPPSTAREHDERTHRRPRNRPQTHLCLPPTSGSKAHLHECAQSRIRRSNPHSPRLLMAARLRTGTLGGSKSKVFAHGRAGLRPSWYGMRRGSGQELRLDEPFARAREEAQAELRPRETGRGWEGAQAEICAYAKMDRIRPRKG